MSSSSGPDGDCDDVPPRRVEPHRNETEPCVDTDERDDSAEESADETVDFGADRTLDGAF
ncbi:hypothetical protein [Halorussus pelagicus]|uniref:hypothetical protein n=1 Tax=Halorussus pelagicus TaxID=2505977 RepID=UPI000FFCA957|nr:hypothetical protein [Halorussus pelagicus]